MSQEASRARSPRKQPSRPSLGGGTPAQDRELRAQGRETVRRLLEAGMIEFETRGFQGVRVDDVVQRAGISHGTFYLYFSNKEDLFKALLKDALHDMEIVAGDFPVVTRDDNGHRVLRQWVRKFFKAYAAHATVLRILSSADLVPEQVYGDALRLFFSIAEAMTTGMTAASKAAGQQQEHVELTAVACLMMLERINYLISAEVRLPEDEMADRIADIMYAAFAPVSLRNAAGARVARKLPRPRLPRRRWARWVLGIVAGFVAIGLLLGGTATGLLVAEDSGPISAAAHSTRNDALWLGHAWVDGRKSQADVDRLAAQLSTTGIRDLFVHSGPLNDNGTLSPGKYPEARWLVAALHRALPHVRVQAWLGDLVGGGGLDLESAVTRANIVTSARQILAAAGFDGVHLDLEPVASGDPGYLTLLSQVRQVTPLLSVSADQVAPLSWLAIPFYRPHWWSAGYLHEVAIRVNEVAIMTYDSGMPTGAMYAGYVHRQTELALAALPPATTLLIGAPAYHTSDFGHSGAETVSAAIRARLASRVGSRSVLTRRGGRWASRCTWTSPRPPRTGRTTGTAG